MIFRIRPKHDCRQALIFTSLLLSLQLLIGPPTKSLAGILTESDFSASSVLIDFNGLNPGNFNNVGSSGFTDGEHITIQYAPLGITFSVPDPRTNFEAIAAHANSPAFSGNMALVNRGGGDFSNVSPLEISLGVPANKFGTRFSISARSELVMQLYSSSNELLDSYTFSNPGTSGQVGFLGLSAAQNIALVKMSSTFIAGSLVGRSLNFSLDDVRFESTITTQTVDSGNPAEFVAIPPGTGSVEVDLPTTTGGSFSAVFETTSSSQAATSGLPGGGPVDFMIPGSEFQYWSLDYSGTFDQILGATVVFNYDPSLLLPGTDESLLAIYHFDDGEWVLQNGIVDTDANTITVSGIKHFSLWGTGLTPAAAAAVPEPATFAIWGLGTLGCVIAGYRRRKTAA